MKKILITLCSLVLVLASTHLNAGPLGTAFTYQGRLDDNGQPANSTIPMVFRLWDDPTTGFNVGSPSSVSANVTVANGLFSIDLDFGAAAFSGDARWLEIRVNGTLLTTRQRVAPTPHALYASMAGTANGVTANGVSGISLQTGLLHFNRPTYLHENTLYFGADASHGVGWRSTYAGAGIDGPVLFGYGGGGLGSTVPDVLALSWNRQGNVGIGTATPQTRLDVNGDVTVRGYLSLEANRTYLGGFDGAGNHWFGYGTDRTDSDIIMGFHRYGPNTYGLRLNGTMSVGVNVNVDGHLIYSGQQNKLDVADNFTATVRCGDFKIGGTSVPGRRPTPGRALVDFASELHLNYASDWANTVIGGNNVSVCTLTIRGGCDLAEPFPMKECQIEKGSVVVIDEEHCGRLKLSTRAYDTRVAGIVSGANGVNPGIALHQEGVIEGGQNVALTGRVYVQADASSSPIKPGDLLTTSSTPGHAMKVSDHLKAQGAIIGKAMSTLQEGKGMVLVLVTLQ